MRLVKTDGTVIVGNQLLLPEPGATYLIVADQGTTTVQTSQIIGGSIVTFVDGGNIRYRMTKTDGSTLEGDAIREVKGQGGGSDLLQITSQKLTVVNFADIASITTESVPVPDPALLIDFLSPLSSTVITAQPFDVFISAESAVTSVNLSLDGVALATISTRTNNAFKYTWSAALPADGSHTFRAVGTNAGATNTGESTVTFVVSAAVLPISCQFEQPLASWVLNNQDLRIVVAADTVATQCEFRIDGTTLATVTVRNAEGKFETLQTGPQVAAMTDSIHNYEAIVTGAGRTGTASVLVQKQGTVVVVPPPVLPPGGPTNLAEPPRIWINSAFALPAGQTITVNATDNLQNALNTATPGSKILIQAGANFIGNFTFPAKASGAPIYVMTSAWQSLPAEGIRFSPAAHSSLVARLTSPNTLPALNVLPGAHDVRFVGMEFSSSVSNQDWVQNIIDVGTRVSGNPADGQFSLMPDSIGFDRVWVHGLTAQNVKRGIALNCRRGYVVDSYVADVHILGWADTQAVACWWGAGPIKLFNNYLEAAGENVMFGGDTSWFQDNITADVEVRRNHLFKKTSWRPGSGDYAGTAWGVKNIFEMKHVYRCWVEGNIMENSWVGAQNGFAVVFNPSANHPWENVLDVVIKNNIIRHAGNGFQIQGWNHLNTHGGRYEITNNMIDDISMNLWRDTALYPAGFGRQGDVMQIIAHPQQVWIEHNFARSTGRETYNVSDGDVPGSKFRNNVMAHGWETGAILGGMMGDNQGDGDAALNAYWPGCEVTKNVHYDPFAPADNPAPRYTQHPGNVFPTQAAVQFVNFAGGNYRLGGASPYKNFGTDAKDPGPDWAALEAACGVTIP